jgi:hypothetical protein
VSFIKIKLILSTYLHLFLRTGLFPSYFQTETPYAISFPLLTLPCRPRCTVQTIICHMLPVSVYRIVVNAFKGTTNLKEGTAMAQLVEALHHKPEGRGFDSRWCHWHKPFGRTMALGLTQPLTEMGTRNISWGVNAAGA